MASAFDPYLQWLGIRDPQRPPNHYRLLGLELFENDASVISMSADRQMAHLRNFKTGPESEVAERLLNELSAARICLLKPDRKAVYDNQLRSGVKPVTSPKTAQSVAPPAISAIAPVVRANASGVKTAIPTAKAAWKPWAILASLVFLCGGLTVMLLNKNTTTNDEKIAVAPDRVESKTPPVKDKPKPQLPVKPLEMTSVTAKSPAKTEVKTNELSGSLTTPPQKSLPNEQETKLIAKPLPENVSEDNNKQPPNKQPLTTSPNIDPTLLLGEEVVSKIPEKSTGSETPLEEPAKKTEPTLVAQVPAIEAAKPTRLAVPDKATIAAKEKEIREIFADEYKSQKPEVKSALAAKLRLSSTESKDNSTMRYVLLNEARANAILGGAVKLAVEITDELVRDYDASDNDERFTLFSKLLAGANRNAAYSQLVLEELRKSLAQLQESDEYDVALKLVNMAMAAARNIRDPALVTELTQRAKELNLQKQSFQRAKVAKESLAKSPNDPAANELWGTYLSFTKDKFNAGLPFLARGTSPDLADLAARELANKQTQPEQLQLADDWWAYGEKLQTQDAVRSVILRQHAGQKYVTLFPKLNGIDKIKAEKRINELKKLADQKSRREVDKMMAQLMSTKWQVDFATPGSAPETMVFRPDGTILTNRVFFTWAIENNELVMRGAMIGKIRFNYTSFEVDYYHKDGRLDYQGKAKPAPQ